MASQKWRKMRRPVALTTRRRYLPPRITQQSHLHSLGNLKKKGGQRPPFFMDHVTVISLLHNELLGVGTSIDEVDATGETVEVDGIHADVAFHGADSLAHDVVDHDVAAVAEDDVE